MSSRVVCGGLAGARSEPAEQCLTIFSKRFRTFPNDVEHAHAFRDDLIAERAPSVQAVRRAGTLVPVNLPDVRSRLLTAIAALTLALTACSSHKAATSPSGPPTQTATPATTATPTADQATVQACADAKDSTSGDAAGDKHAQDARSWAELSDVPTLREIAAKYARGTESEGIEMAHLYTAANLISAWCLGHGLGGVG